MRKEKLKEITGSLSKPSKMPGHAYGLPAKECKTGGKLQKVKGSTCEHCYALKGCYVFKVVQAAQYKRLEAIKHPQWVQAMAQQINSKKTKFFRWHDSGDVQDVEHLLKIFEVCRLSPDVQHWMPTREAARLSAVCIRGDVTAVDGLRDVRVGHVGRRRVVPPVALGILRVVKHRTIAVPLGPSLYDGLPLGSQGGLLRG